MTERRMEELEERLDEAVESGALTQEQADTIRATAENWVPQGPGLPGPGLLDRPFGPGTWQHRPETSN